VKVQDVMTSGVVWVFEDTPFKTVAEILTTRRFGAVPVVDVHEHLVGIVSETDLLGKEAYGSRHPDMGSMVSMIFRGTDREWVRKAEALVARDLMTARVHTAHPEEPLRSAVRRMAEERVKQLPVVDGGRVIGILARSDVIRVFTAPDPVLLARAGELLQRCAYVEPEHEVHVDVVDGVVRVTGTVNYESDTRVLEAIIGAMEGVIGVENRLRYRYVDPGKAR